ncbi:MAG: pyridoxal-phosphate dependent enzyme, partial [Pseudomonadota bacterium]
SNFVRLAAAAAARLGLHCHVQLEDRVAHDNFAYRNSGNVLLDRLLGATVHYFPEGEDEVAADARIREIADTLAEQGRRPYVIPLAPGHPPLGALGYVDCAEEILEQCGDDGRPNAFDEIIVASGSGSTHGGLVFGLRSRGDATPVLGVCVRRSSALQTPRIQHRCRELAALLHVDNPVPDADVRTDDTDLAPGYGQCAPHVQDVILRFARREAILCDPVYTGKVCAAVVRRAQALGAGKRLLMMHTGGTPGLFAYPELNVAASA